MNKKWLAISFLTMIFGLILLTILFRIAPIPLTLKVIIAILWGYISLRLFAKKIFY